MSSETNAGGEPVRGTAPSAVTFDVGAVEHDRGVRDRERIVGDVRWALVEYRPGAGRDGWCTQPHMGYVVSGTLEYAFEDGRAPLALQAGDGFVLPSQPGHAGRNRGAEPAQIFIIDALTTGDAPARGG